jgi:putative oxidoreductase
MILSNSCLLLGGVASLLIVLLHLALALRPQWYRHFGADELAQMHEQGSRFTVLVTLGLAWIFAVWGIYALSGAGMIEQLPLLRSVLIAIGVIYVLRSLMLPSELFKVLLRGYPLRFVVFSTGSLAAGLLHLIGTLAR